MKVLVVDDDLALADIISFTMRRSGFQVVVAHDGWEALQRWQSENPDLILLDLNIPRVDGFNVCRQIRSEANTPIIILSVRDQDEDVINGLQLGADDYIVKPFSPREVVARVQTVLRRASANRASNNHLEVGIFHLNLANNELNVGERPLIRITPLENRLLDILMRNSGRIVPTERLIDYVWESAGGDRIMLKQLVYRLRRKIEPDPSSPMFIETSTNVGYCLNPHQPMNQ